MLPTPFVTAETRNDVSLTRFTKDVGHWFVYILLAQYLPFLHLALDSVICHSRVDFAGSLLDNERDVSLTCVGATVVDMTTMKCLDFVHAEWIGLNMTRFLHCKAVLTAWANW